MIYHLCLLMEQVDSCIFWKCHIASDFESGNAPVGNNGVGIGGHCFRDFNDMCSRIDVQRYYAIPVVLFPWEYRDCGDGIVESLVDRMGIGEFSAIGRIKSITECN